MELFHAVEKNNINEVIKLLNREDIDINLKDNVGWTVLMFVSKNGNIDIVKLLCNFDQRSKFTGQSGFQPDCSLLKRKDIDINLQTTYDGWTALMYASIHGNIDIAGLLLKKENIDINIKNKRGWTALMYAASIHGKIDIARLLLEKEKIDINIQNNNGDTALMFASYNNNIDIIKLLLEKENIDINIQDNNGRTVLIIASFTKNIDIVKLLNEYNLLLSLSNLI
jgi:ankyrin repeat protein